MAGMRSPPNPMPEPATDDGVGGALVRDALGDALVDGWEGHIGRKTAIAGCWQSPLFKIMRPYGSFSNRHCGPPVCSQTASTLADQGMSFVSKAEGEQTGLRG
jgi:hypothetical protein